MPIARNTLGGEGVVWAGAGTGSCATPFDAMATSLTGVARSNDEENDRKLKTGEVIRPCIRDTFALFSNSLQPESTGTVDSWLWRRWSSVPPSSRFSACTYTTIVPFNPYFHFFSNFYFFAGNEKLKDDDHKYHPIGWWIVPRTPSRWHVILPAGKTARICRASIAKPENPKAGAPFENRVEPCYLIFVSGSIAFQGDSKIAVSLEIHFFPISFYFHELEAFCKKTEDWLIGMIDEELFFLIHPDDCFWILSVFEWV